MIVKIQAPIYPADGPFLLYDMNKEWSDFIEPKDLPPNVVAAVRETGKAYFHAEETEEEIKFGKQAPAQDW